MSRWFSAAAIVAVPLVLVALNVHLLATEAFVRWEYDRAAIPLPPGMTSAERLALAVPSTRFIVNTAEPSALAALSHSGTPLYTEAEIGHLVDVRRLVRLLTALGLLSVAVLAAAAVSWWRGDDRAQLARALRTGGGLAVGLVLFLAVAVLVAWPIVFTGFHVLLFPPGTWQFAPDSGLIRLFPERFWYDAAAAMLGMTVVQGLVLVLLGWRLGRESRRA